MRDADINTYLLGYTHTKTIYTVGHSNRSLAAFLGLLQTHQISRLVDVRAIPKSRRLPWFNQDALCASLQDIGVRYHHIQALGGRRAPQKISINTGWKNASFRAYADYMQTNAFIMALDELLNLMKQRGKLAIMCAESLPWRCHRSLISDALIIRSYQVIHLMSATQTKIHQLTDFAVVDPMQAPIKIFYPEKNYTLDL